VILADSHIHTNFSPDSPATMESMVSSGVRLGLAEMALTDHADWDFATKKIARPVDLKKRRDTFESVREKYGERVKLVYGVEIGLSDDPDILGEIKDFLYKMKPDFIIGSLHDYRGEDYYYPPYYERRAKHDAYRDYFAAMLACVEAAPKFDTLGHMDYMERYARYDDPYFLYADHADIIREILLALIKKGAGIELNTAGVKYGVFRKTAPMFDIIRKYRELGGGRVTFGSDAHTPEYVASGFDEAERWL
jgi:histidinol-phosphatase (PHP family)